jgi:methylenetetrahydrofolate dehydrogenase (NADP+)/methenyltetrahydrofolate cyclohydrolase
MLDAIATLNADHNVTGVIIQRPVPPSIAIKELETAVHPLKDVSIIPPRSPTSSTTTWCSGFAPRSPRSRF